MQNTTSNKTANTGVSITLMLGKANADELQDAWHYATLILNRKESTFDGDREYPEGIRGQVKAYEHLLTKLDDMTANDETWGLYQSRFWHPCDMVEMVSFARIALTQVERKAELMGLDPRTGERL